VPLVWLDARVGEKGTNSVEKEQRSVVEDRCRIKPKQLVIIALRSRVEICSEALIARDAGEAQAKKQLRQGKHQECFSLTFKHVFIDNTMERDLPKLVRYFVRQVAILLTD